MEVHILGPVGMVSRGRLTGLGSDKERLILASLALVVGRPIAIDTLIDRLWEGQTPETARPNVHTYISRIRRALAKAGEGSDAPRIRGHAHTYTLEAAPESVDWHRYRETAERARRLVAEGDDDAAGALLRQADLLWQGEALAGLPGSWAGQMRLSLTESRLSVTSSRIAAELRMGRFSELVGELSALVQQYPSHQTLAGQLMIAYYGDRRHADALRVYREVRRALRAEDGLDPDEELTRIHRHVLDRAPLRELIPGPPNGPRPPRSPAPRSNLPRHNPLVGREPEMRRLRAAAEAAGDKGAIVALEAISGMAGVGKTALAVNAARQLRERFPDGQFHIELRAHDLARQPLTTGAALASLLRHLGVPATSIPLDVEERAVLGRNVLSRRRAVIILDDADGPEQIRPLLPTESGSLFIITSRRRLSGLPGVRSIALDVLPPADAMALFRSFAADDRTEDDAELSTVVHLLGYLPLALELAANRFGAHPSWSLATLRERLSRGSGRLSEIRDGDSEIARAFELSYQTLTADQRAAFRRLGLHVGGGFGPHAAATLMDLPLERTERLLESLLRCHLLQEPTPHRYRFHDLLGEYAHALALSEETAEERDAAQRRLIEFYLHAAARADRVLYPRRPRLTLPAPPVSLPIPTPRDAEDGRQWLTTERSNLLAVERDARHGRAPDRAALLSHVLAEFLHAESHWVDTERMHRHAVDHWQRAGLQRPLCLGLLALGNTYAATGNYPEARRTCQRALEIASTVLDADAEVEAVKLLGIVHWHLGENRTALAFHEKALALRAVGGVTHDRVRHLNNIAISLIALGDHGRAREFFLQVIGLLQEEGDERNLCKALNNLGDLYINMGQPESAREVLEQSIDLAEASGSLSDLTTARANLASILTAGSSEEVSSALRMYEACLETFSQLGDRKNEANALMGAGKCLHRMRDFAAAMRRHSDALKLTRAIGAAHEEAQALRGMAEAETAFGHLDAASGHLHEAITAAERIAAQGEAARARAALAEVRHLQGRKAEARALWMAAHKTLLPLDRVHAAQIHARLDGGATASVDPV
ncbi:AfsR/SARP family transcriptional regulator [Streptomyces sp. NBC_01803]|uniref:AfsR/SARP family transcriptional regulator n=1 Tax=Streptomyces sp. NBC_01803 TaxID=2975946 RepID=UPI002DDC3CE3|nr:BTAD domain-containing putative transcriptional regulator [Streptomyces sp. NBC_01803]WSA45425.1 tetratricopeptide repeat protein [Streptomyces sp. NBC_01803]